MQVFSMLGDILFDSLICAILVTCAYVVFSMCFPVCLPGGMRRVAESMITRDLSSKSRFNKPTYDELVERQRFLNRLGERKDSVELLLASIDRKIYEVQDSKIPLSDEDSFTLSELVERYLPDTLRIFDSVPMEFRDMPDEKGFIPELSLEHQLTIFSAILDGIHSRCGAISIISMRNNEEFLSRRFFRAE